MGESKRRRVLNTAVNEITRAATDNGLLIEAGWLAMKAACINPDAPPEQLQEMRMAFFAGAQHLWGSVMSVLEEGEEATEADLKRLDLINDELLRFIEQFKLRSVPTEGTA